LIKYLNLNQKIQGRIALKKLVLRKLHKILQLFLKQKEQIKISNLIYPLVWK